MEISCGLNPPAEEAGGLAENPQAVELAEIPNPEKGPWVQARTNPDLYRVNCVRELERMRRDELNSIGNNYLDRT